MWGRVVKPRHLLLSEEKGGPVGRRFLRLPQWAALGCNHLAQRKRVAADYVSGPSPRHL